MCYWAGTPDQHRQNNRLYRRMRTGAVKRELSRKNDECFLSPGDVCVPRTERHRRSRDTVVSKGAHVYYKRDDGLRWLGQFNASTTEHIVYLVRCVDDPRSIKLPFLPAHYTTSTGAY